MSMDTARLAAIRAREQAATLGDWSAVYDGDWQVEERDLPDELNPPQICYQARHAHPNTPANMKFIAAARADVPDLLAEVERLRAGLESLRESHTADCISHHRGLENSCTCIPDRLTIFHNARIDALLNGGHG